MKNNSRIGIFFLVWGIILVVAFIISFSGFKEASEDVGMMVDAYNDISLR